MELSEVMKRLSIPVELRDAGYEKDGKFVRGLGKQVVRTDTGLALSSVSDNYGLVTHLDSLSPVLMRLDEQGFSIKKVAMDHDGRKVMVMAVSKRKWTVKNGDEVTLALKFGNSYDRTKALSMDFGAFRFICANGLMIAHEIFANVNINLRVIHSLGSIKIFDPAILTENVDQLYTVMDQQVAFYQNMLRQVFKKTALESLREKVLAPVIGERGLDLVVEKTFNGKGQDGILSSYSLLQGLTEYLTEKSDKSKTPVSANFRQSTKELQFHNLLSTWIEQNPEQLVTVNA